MRLSFITLSIIAIIVIGAGIFLIQRFEDTITAPSSLERGESVFEDSEQSYGSLPATEREKLKRVQSPTPVPTLQSSKPSGFYTQIDNANGITIKAPNSVDPAALRRVKQIVQEMLGNARSDVASRMITNDPSIAIIPKNSFITILPEYEQFKGKSDRNGNPYDSFKIRGAGGVVGQPVTAVSEENLLKLPGDPFSQESVIHHEFAHAVMNLGFGDQDREKWLSTYESAKKRNTFPGTFAMVHPDEYWAELTQSYFGVNNEIGGREAVKAGDPDAFQFLLSIYSPK